MNRVKYAIKLLIFVLIMLFGVFMIVYGEYDDSPGGQLLGLVLVIISIVGVVKAVKKDWTRKQIL